MDTHVLEYEHEGRIYLFESQARSEEEFIARIDRLRNGRYLGVARIVEPGGGVAPKVALKLRATFKRWLEPKPP